MVIRALYYDGETSNAHPVELSLANGELGISGIDKTARVWSSDEVKAVEKPTSTTPLRLRRGFDGDERLVIADENAQIEIMRYFPLINQQDKVWSRNAKRLVGWGSAAIASLVFTVLVAIPMIAQQISDSLPASYEHKMGEQAYEQIIKTLTFIERKNSDARLTCVTKDNSAERHLAELAGRLLPDKSLENRPQIKVVNFKMENAFALPGGHIVLFRGLLENLQHPDELAGILAHEIGHVVYRHTTKIFIEQAGTSALIGLIFGDVTGGTAIAGLGQALLNSAHTREAEQEADAYALNVLNRENISAVPAARFFERLFAEQGHMEQTLSLLNTHPMSNERATFFKDHATGTKPSLSDDAWKAIKNMCADPPSDNAS